MKKKFKSGDFIENIYTGEIEMIDEIESTILGGFCLYVYSEDWSQFVKLLSLEQYRVISPKEIKFNLK